MDITAVAGYKVGLATTNAVVSGCILILIFNYLFELFLSGGVVQWNIRETRNLKNLFAKSYPRWNNLEVCAGKSLVIIGASRLVNRF